MTSKQELLGQSVDECQQTGSIERADLVCVEIDKGAQPYICLSQATCVRNASSNAAGEQAVFSQNVKGAKRASRKGGARCSARRSAVQKRATTGVMRTNSQTRAGGRRSNAQTKAQRSNEARRDAKHV
eukprot:4784019-Pleurochrysis_carterae.AAC.3